MAVACLPDWACAQVRYERRIREQTTDEVFVFITVFFAKGVDQRTAGKRRGTYTTPMMWGITVGERMRD
jgi:hypothetical protein